MVCPCIKNAPSTAAPSSRKRAYDVNQDITILISTKCQSQKNAAKKKTMMGCEAAYQLTWLTVLPAFNLKKKQKKKLEFTLII